MIRPRNGILVAVLLSLAAGCHPSVEGIELLEPAVGARGTHVAALLGPDYVEGSLVLRIDGAAIRTGVTHTAAGAAALVAGLGAGEHELSAQALFAASGRAAPQPRGDSLRFRVPDPAPALIASDPPAGATDVPRSAWLRLEYAGAVPRSAQDRFELLCSGVGADLSLRRLAVHAVEPHVLVVNPAGDLPAGSPCLLSWPGPDGTGSLGFWVAGAGDPAPLPYDRRDPHQLHPFPDDFWLADDPGTRTGRRVAMSPPPDPQSTRALFAALLAETNRLDGWSPIAHWVVELPDAPDPDSLPSTPAESQGPLASVGIFDLDPASPGYGRRVPFRSEIRDDRSAGGRGHVLLIFPSVPLEPGGRYGLVVTRRALVDATRPFEPSGFFGAALARPMPGERPEVAAVRSLAEDVLAVVESAALPPIPREDVALALRVSVRSTADISRDLLAVKRQLLAAPPPALVIESCEPPSFGVPEEDAKLAAIIRGSWEAPDWRLGGANFARDADGEILVYPGEVPTRPVEFVLALPAAARDGNPVPLTLYQHGSPGSAESEVPGEARRTLAEAGFAVVGFTDVLNRELSGGQTGGDAANDQAIAIFFALLADSAIPDAWQQTNAEQLAFLRALEGLDEALPDLPFDRCAEAYAVDLEAPITYLGVSEGANHAPAFLPYAPEIAAAALVAGGSRLTEVLIHQRDDLFVDPAGPIGILFPHVTPAEIWTAAALFQGIHDAQDAHNHARFWFREPIAIQGDLRKPSVLLIEGLDDTRVPNHATESLAYQLGVPVLGPAPREVPFLDAAAAPVTANLGRGTTGALARYVPQGVTGIPPTPGCVPPAVPEGTAEEGHFCAQSAAESREQRRIFFQTALSDEAPTIIDPLSQ